MPKGRPIATTDDWSNDGRERQSLPQGGPAGRADRGGHRGPARPDQSASRLPRCPGRGGEDRRDPLPARPVLPKRARRCGPAAEAKDFAPLLSTNNP